MAWGYQLSGTAAQNVECVGKGNQVATKMFLLDPWSLFNAQRDVASTTTEGGLIDHTIGGIST